MRLQGGPLAGQLEGTVSSLGLLYTTFATGEDSIMVPNSVVLNVAVLPLREPEAVNLRARLRAGMTPGDLQEMLEKSLQTPLRDAPRITLEELDGEEVVVRISATPRVASEGRQLAASCSSIVSRETALGGRDAVAQEQLESLSRTPSSSSVDRGLELGPGEDAQRLAAPAGVASPPPRASGDERQEQLVDEAGGEQLRSSGAGRPRTAGSARRSARAARRAPRAGRAAPSRSARTYSISRRGARGQAGRGGASGSRRGPRARRAAGCPRPRARRPETTHASGSAAEAPFDPQLPAGRVADDPPVALGAHRAGAGHDRVDGHAQPVEQRPVGAGR